MNRMRGLIRLNVLSSIIALSLLSFLNSGAFASTLWDNTFTPAITADSDTNAVELGVKFQSTLDGYITGFRFYKSSTNTGTHVGSLWTTGGTLLSSVTFANETASGWQEMDLPEPVAITAGTTYVASYHTTVGRYSADVSYFNGAGFDNPPLRALADGENGGNGVYLYGAGGFPNRTWNATNYWVDVVFQENLNPDTTPPTVSSVSPTDGATDVATDGVVTAAFSEPMDPATINATTFTLDGITAVVTYDAGTNTATLDPSDPLDPDTTYTATVDGVTDIAGNLLDDPYVWSFTTALSSGGDTEPPTVIAFTIPEEATTLTVSITSFTATDDAGVTGYLVTETSTPPSASDGGWSATAPTSYTFAAPGSKTLYAWAKDAAGNVSASASAAVTITPSDTTPPVVSSTSPADGATGVSTGTVVTVSFSEAMEPTTINTTSFTLSGAAATVAYNDASHTATLDPAAPLEPDTTYTATVDGVTDAAGNSLEAPYVWSFTTASSSGGDTTPPTVSTFTIPATATTLTVFISSFTANDNIGVTGYLLTESSAVPTPTAAGWSATAPSSYIFDSAGSKTLYAWAKDAASNVSDSLSDSVVLTLPDTTPPTVESVSPAGGATEVATDAVLTVTFSEAMDPATINATTFTLDGMPAVVTYDAGTKAAMLEPAVPLSPDTTYTATVDGVADAAGNALAAPHEWSFTTAAGGSSNSSSLWDDTFIPTILSDSDTNAVELGVKFQSDVDGSITALRFYKSSANTGTHTGHLWTSAGTLLASVTFTNETTSGWQEMSLATPVAISAGTTYIASYHAPAGRYSADSAYFTAAYDNPPLTAPSSGSSGGNGVYRYGAAGGFPNQTWNATNYWVDVVFQEGSGSSDTTPPVVTDFVIPSTATTLTVLITSFTATDDAGVTGYLVTETSTPPSASDGGWSATAPTSYTFAAPGSKTLYAWAKDAAGNVSASASAAVTITPSDTTPPVVSSTSPADGATGVSTGTVVTVNFSEAMEPTTINTTSFTLSGAAATIAYNEASHTATLDPAAPLEPDTTYTATVAGVTDAAGNSLEAPYVWSFTTASSSGGDTTPPTVSTFTIPATATTLTVTISSFTANDNIGVTGYLLTESSAAPAPTAAGWSATAPSSYIFDSAGSKTLYAWAKDAAGNVSDSLSASVTITLADTTPPQVTAFTIPATSMTLTVPITTFTATDAVGVTGYLVNESSATPLVSAAGWSATAPASYSFESEGSKTLYAWAKDAAGNVSASRSASVTITLLSAGPEPAGWYAGDPHVHRSCGGTPIDLSTMRELMGAENLAVISLLADMGNGEVQDTAIDLPRVNGENDPVSTPDRIVHWDAEWHWDATYSQFPHQALGGHIVALGLTEAHQIWEEYTAPIFQWVHDQGGIAGFAHLQPSMTAFSLQRPELLQTYRISGRGRLGRGRFHFRGCQRQRFLHSSLLPLAQHRLPAWFRGRFGPSLQCRCGAGPDLCPGRGRPDDLRQLDRGHRQWENRRIAQRAQRISEPGGRRQRHAGGRDRSERRRNRVGGHPVDREPELVRHDRAGEKRRCRQQCIQICFTGISGEFECDR